MQFRMLGPLTVENDRGPVALGGPKPRALLAALLVEAGRVVSADRLVVALWGESPPPGAVSALRAYASRLRGALGAGQRLRFQAPGYVLSLDGAALDATAFEQHLGAARRAAAADDHAAALQRLDAGLALWRGDALAEFADLEFAAAEAGRLNELRAAAVEDRLEALVRLGRPADAIPDLEALVRRHPTRERTTVVLMHALYGSGRAADALAAYHALRQHLADELGVDPGQDAEQAYLQVLAHDPALTTGRHGTGVDAGEGGAEVDVRSAAAELLARFPVVLVERLATGGVAELLVGVHSDPVFGPVLSLGSGGVLAELVRDVAHLLLPVDGTEIRRALLGLRCAPLLAGYRGGQAADVDGLVSVVEQVCDLVLHTPEVVALEINPLVVTATDAWACDALLEAGRG